VEKNTHHCLPEELEAGDCWIALSLAQLNGLILCGRVGKRTDSLAIELVTSTQGRTDCTEWHTDGWSGYERVLCTDDEVEHYIGKILTQRLERTNGSLRQQTARWHRRQNKFGKVWEQTKVTLGVCRNTWQMGHVVKFCKQKRLKLLICRDFEAKVGSVEPKILEALGR
jgi:IS1 family transposase